jgi:hypothetical protein
VSTLAFRGVARAVVASKVAKIKNFMASRRFNGLRGMNLRRSYIGYGDTHGNGKVMIYNDSDLGISPNKITISTRIKFARNLRKYTRTTPGDHKTYGDGE